MRRKFPPPDLSDLVWSKAGLQHRIHDDVVEPGGLIRPCEVGAFSDTRILLTGAARRRASRATTGATARARAGWGELGVCADADMIDADDIDECPDIPCIVQRHVRQMCPDTDRATGIGDHFGLLFADESWAHHLRHARIAPQLGIEAGVGDDDRAGRDLECGFRGLDIGMSKVDEQAQPIAFLDDSRSEGGQSAIFRSVGENKDKSRTKDKSKEQSESSSKTAGFRRLTSPPMSDKPSWMGHPILWGGWRRQATAKEMRPRLVC